MGPGVYAKLSSWEFDFKLLQGPRGPLLDYELLAASSLYTVAVDIEILRQESCCGSLVLEDIMTNRGHHNLASSDTLTTSEEGLPMQEQVRRLIKESEGQAGWDKAW